MTKRKEVWDLLIWTKDKSWFVFDPSFEFAYKLTENAPPEAVESYNKWLKYRQENPED